MTFTEIFTFIVFVCGVLASPSSDNVRIDSVFETINIIRANGYQAEIHHVVTSDGYILEMHRIPYRRNETTGDRDRPVVFVMHGLLAASNTFIIVGPEYSIAYNLADAGFDVWMGNARGNKNSRFHVTLDADNPDHRHQFFDFSWEEIGMYDISAMIDYALLHTGKQKLHYIGHSQGGTVFLVLNSMRPEYNEKFASVHLMAGVGYMEYFPNRFLTALAMVIDTIYSLAVSIGFVEIPPPISFNRTNSINDMEHFSDNIKMEDMYVLTGAKEIMRINILEEIENGLNSAGGGAVKQIAHYGHNVRDKVFKRWDYGPEKNLEVYGSTEAPRYNLSLITADVTMHYTVSDILLDERDVLAMAEDMPNTIVRRITKDSFLHSDFIFANDVKELVTDYIIEDINRIEFPAEGGVPGASYAPELSFMLRIYLISCSLYYIIYS